MRKNPFEKFLGEEDHTHKALLDYIRLQHRPFAEYLAHPTNEGKRSAFERFKIKWLGISSGLQDILLFFPIAPYRGLAIEVKASGKKATEEQLKWRTRLTTCGWLAVVVDNFMSGKFVIDEYFNQSK